MFSGIYDKSSNEGGALVYNYDIKDAGFHNDIDGGYPIYPQGTLSNGSVVQVVEPIDFMYFVNTPYNKQIVPRYDNTSLNATLSNIAFLNNPIIMIVHE